jgi:membrane fusion protein (multidrug efflux system)
LFRRHFFLVGALVLLVLMGVAGGLKLMGSKAGAGGSDASAPAAGQGKAGGAAARGGGGGGFGGPTIVSAAVVQPRVFQDDLEVLGVAKGRRSVTLTAATTQLID